MRKGLVPGERVADVAPTFEHASWTDASSRDVPVCSPGSTVSYLVIGSVIGLVLDVTWPAPIAILIAAVAVEVGQVRPRRAHGGPERRRSMRSLVMVTDRRLIEGVHPNEFRESPLDRVKDVQARGGNTAMATLRISTDTGDTDIHVGSDWPKRRAIAAAEAIAEDIRRGAA